VVKRSRLTNTAKIIIVVGIVVIVLGGIFSIPNIGINDQPDIGLFTDQLSVAEHFVPFRIGFADRTTTGAIDTTNTVEILTASQVSEIIKELPNNCNLKLLTTIVFEDGSKRRFSTGATSFAPIGTLSLVTEQGQVIERFETIPLLTCPEIILSDALGGGRIGYEHEWLSGVIINWGAYKQDGTLFEEGLGTGINTASTLAGGTFFGAPKCNSVVFEDVGDLASTGLYTQAEIQEYSDTFGGGADSIFIGSERALCARDVNGVVAEPFIITADELEQRIESAGKEFETTLIIRPTAGTLILEVPFISQQIGEPFVSINGIDQTVTKQFLSFTVDNLSDEPDPADITPPPTGVTRTLKTISFNPVKIDVANLEDDERTVTWRISLNSYDSSEGIPNIVVKADQSSSNLLTQVLFPSGTSASFPMRDAGISGDSRLFEGKWIVPTGQSLGTYELTVSMVSRINDLAKVVEVVQSAEDAPRDEPDSSGNCKRGQQLVQDFDGNSICVAECADSLIWDKIQSACAVEASCTGDLVIITKDDGTKTCGKPPITEGMCDEGLDFIQDTMQCEAPTSPPPPKVTCNDNEQLVNTGGGTASCFPKLPDFIKALTPIACVDKIGFTEEGFCLPPVIVGLFQNPIQLIYVGIALIILIVVIKIISKTITRSRGGIILNQ